MPLRTNIIILCLHICKFFGNCIYYVNIAAFMYVDIVLCIYKQLILLFTTACMHQTACLVPFNTQIHNYCILYYDIS